MLAYRTFAFFGWRNNILKELIQEYPIYPQVADNLK